jgi:hypothetical protein
MPISVVLTIDTECWPKTRGWRESAMEADINRDIYGVVDGGEYGLRFQMQLLNAHRLRAVFFVESLFASVIGSDPLRRIVTEILAAGHDVQLHAHPEWLRWIELPGLPPAKGSHLKLFTMSEQAQILGHSLVNLRAAGAPNVRAFRAGNFGANEDTLRALATHRILFDTSHNMCVRPDCELFPDTRPLQPFVFEGVTEYPVSIFEDWPRHFRPLQLCACSSREIERFLWTALKAGWGTVVLVSHTFELIRAGNGVNPRARSCPIVIRRMERLCKFLDRYRDDFRTATFGDEEPAWSPDHEYDVIRGSRCNTLLRYAERAYKRWT